MLERTTCGIHCALLLCGKIQDHAFKRLSNRQCQKPSLSQHYFIASARRKTHRKVHDIAAMQLIVWPVMHNGRRTSALTIDWQATTGNRQESTIITAHLHIYEGNDNRWVTFRFLAIGKALTTLLPPYSCGKNSAPCGTRCLSRVMWKTHHACQSVTNLETDPAK